VQGDLKKRLEKLETKQPGGRFDAKLAAIAAKFGYELDELRSLVVGYEKRIDENFRDEGTGTLEGFKLLISLGHDKAAEKIHSGCEPRAMR
jgi:hypothetical protein